MLKGTITGTQELDDANIASNSGGLGKRKLSVTGTATYNFQKTFTKKSLTVSVGITPEWTANIGAKYTDKDKKWTANGQVKGSMQMANWNQPKKFPKEPIDMAEKLPKLRFPIVPGVEAQVFLGGQAYLFAGPLNSPPHWM